MTDNEVRVSLDVSAIPAQIAGAGRYVYELARQLSSEPIDLQLISRTDDAQRWQNLGAAVTAKAPTSRPLRLAWEQLKMPGAIKDLDVDLHHGPHYTLPKLARTKKVVTIHDMTFFEFPQWHEKAKVQFFRRAIESSVKQADEIVSVSGYTATRIRAHFGDLPVTVIPHGVDHSRFVPTTTDLEVKDKEVLLEAGIEGEFIAYVGTVEPRKNVPSLIGAFEKIATSHRNFKLVIAGRPGWGPDQTGEAIARSPIADRILRVGYLSDEAIPALLRRARAVAYPSLVEGFGLPALEALACGAVLVTTKGSAMEEVVQDAALLIEPGNDEQLAEALESALVDQQDHKRVRGPEVAAAFTWKACSDAHLDLYARVARG